MDLGNWTFDSDFNIEDWFGFLYRITELHSGKEYIGKKQFFSHRTKVVKDRKNRKHYKKESDWKQYTGSSADLNKAIELYGKENYKFEILSLHKSKGSLHYSEVETQILENVLKEKLADGSKKYYNRQIAGVKFIPPDEVNEKTISKISEALITRYSNKMNFWYNQLSDEEKNKFRGDNCTTKRNKTSEEYENWLDENMRGENNPMFGKPSPLKGKDYEEIYGTDRASEIKQVLSKSCGRSGEENGMFGKTHSDEQIEKWKHDERRIHPGEKNGMYGKPCFYKMSEEEIALWKENISKASKGKPKSEEHRSKMSQAQKGKPKPTVECPHCKKVGSKGNMVRYHFDYCKLKV